MTRRRVRRQIVAGLVTVCWIAAASSASAQTPSRSPSRAPGRQIHLDIGGSLLAPSSFASRNADLLTPDGSTLRVTGTEDNRIGPGFGLEAHLGIPLARSLALEASGTWTRVRSSMRVTFDIEDAPLLTATLNSSQFTGEGALLVTLVRRGRTEVFARGGAGWLTEVAGGVVIGDGLVYNAGGGVRRWWSDPTPGRRSMRFGLRVEGRVIVREAGFAESRRTMRLSPVIAGSLMMGF